MSLRTTKRDRVNDAEGPQDGKIAELERELNRYREREAERAAIEHALGERIKELNCLYTIVQSVQTHRGAADRLLQEIVEVLPRSWQYPDVTCARILYENRTYVTSDYRRTRWKQASDIIVNGQPAGLVEVFYTQPMPLADEGPFLREERLLINAVADHVGRAMEHVRAVQALELRVKHLDCLHAITRAVEQSANDLKRLLQSVAELVPRAWQHPEYAGARIVLEDERYESRGFRETAWFLSTPISVHGARAGRIEVHYRDDFDERPQDLFLDEEHRLLETIADRLGREFERIRTERQIQVERAALRQANTAMREVLARIDDQRREVEDAVQANVNNILMPLLQEVEAEMPPTGRGYVQLLRRNLEEIVSPFVDKLSRSFANLTPAEVRVSEMIRRGLSTKEIADMRGISPATVNRHREHIRQKLGITNKNVNLATYLRAFMSESDRHHGRDEMPRV